MTNQKYQPVRASAGLDPSSGQVGESAMLLSDINVPEISQCLGVAAVNAGEPATAELAHSTAEVMFVAEGQGELITSEGTVEFSKGDAIYIPADLKHALRNTGASVLVSVFSFPAPNRPADSSTPH
ncbi:cupin domain-containing protein [Brevibacterium sp. SMBL_HHYL_HB1]|uniref:cupin domain-containing protein n=1 Tax=Brevibacterium sp. SMBL_HHYL_HB1 TaxID=2777556 RepID=UPI001BABC27F|nr:cupin domain-containing protein [Brevibacterium sp. SMBL_HHYL_HB1]QUL77872.1 cupin domain-containing protein [Brevibacterium sp. SMBL_HHYL_HB1]